MFGRVLKCLAAAALALAVSVAAPAGERVSDRPQCVPADAPAWVVIPALKGTLEDVRKLVDSIVPGMGAMAQVQLEEVLSAGLPECADPEKPYVVVLEFGKDDVKAGAAAFVKAGLDAAAELEKENGKPAKTEDGIMTFAQVQGGAAPDVETFAAVKDGRVVVGDTKALVKALLAAPPADAAALPKDADLFGGLDVKMLAAGHQKEIEDALKEVEQEAAKEQGPQAPAARMMAKLLCDGVRGALKEVEAAGWQLELTPQAMSVRLGVRAVAGGEFAAALADLGKVKLPAAGLLPEESMINLLFAFPPERLAKLADSGKGFLETLLAGAQDEKLAAAREDLNKMIAMSVSAVKSMDGRMAESVFRRGGGICAVAYGGATDTAAVRTAALGAYKLMSGGAFAEALAQAGVKYTVKEKVRQSNGLDVDQVIAEMKLPAAPGMPLGPEKIIETIYGNPPTVEWAFGKDKYFLAFGKGGPSALDELVKRAQGGEQTAAMAGTLQQAPKGAFVAGEVRLLEFGRMVSEIMSSAMKQMGAMEGGPKLVLPEGPDKNPVTGFLAAADGEFLAEARVPVEPIKQLVQAFQAMMMQQMQKAPAPPPPEAVPAPVE